MDIHRARRIGRCVGAAVWVALLSLSSEATPATAAVPANLLARPGIEASEAALKAVWHPLEPGGYEVDRQEKHSGNQSIKLAIAQKGMTKGVSYVLRSDQVKTPGSILVSAWSKAKDVTGSKDDAYAIYVDVNYADGTNLHQVTARFEPSAPSNLNFGIAKNVDISEPSQIQGGSNEQEVYCATHG